MELLELKVFQREYIFTEFTSLVSAMRFLVILALLVFTSRTSKAFKLLHQSNKVRNKRSDHPKGFGTAKHAVIIGLDGLGGVYLNNISQYPSIQSFFDKGAHTTRSRNVRPPISGPNWVTYLTSMEVHQHGVYDNSQFLTAGNHSGQTYRLPPVPGIGRPQTLFNIIKEHNQTLVTAFLFTWGWFRQITDQNPHIDHWFLGRNGIICGNELTLHCVNRQDWNVQKTAVRIIKNVQPTLTFLQLDSLDTAGHTTHYGSDAYYDMLQQKELQIQGLLEALANTTTKSGKSMIEETIVVIVSDHGGIQKSHDSSIQMFEEVYYVPLLIRGPGVKNVSLDSPQYPNVSALDVGITVLNALGIEKGKLMTGRVLEEIYEDD